jgi:hypothetical protein
VNVTIQFQITYLATQWAPVRTTLGPIREPPQIARFSPGAGFFLSIATIQGNSPKLASLVPPIRLKSIPWLFLIPQFTLCPEALFPPVCELFVGLEGLVGFVGTAVGFVGTAVGFVVIRPLLLLSPPVWELLTSQQTSI